MTKRQRSNPNPCPASDCRGGIGRQRKLNDNEIERIAGLARVIIDEQPYAAMTCMYCGAVYIGEAPKRLLGFLDAPMLGLGWHPLERYK